MQHRARRVPALLFALVALLLAPSLLASNHAGAVPVAAEAAATTSTTTRDATTSGTAAAPGDELTAAKAAVLGIVEGVTEYLPISSTGHLLVTERILDVGQTDATKDAMDGYTVIIQLGAILAVVAVFWPRLLQLLGGIAGRDPAGRQLLIRLAVAFVPAAVIGVALDKTLEAHLLAVGPVIGAWLVGGVVILLLANRWRTGRDTLESITNRQALIIGLAQTLALWPGVSRSLVTMLGGLAVGLSLTAAVEFSFLLGLATLGAATALKVVTDGKDIVDTYGVKNPLIGLVFATVAAFAAVKWMVGYLQRHDLKLFGWYRIGIALVVLVLVGTGTI